MATASCITFFLLTAIAQAALVAIKDGSTNSNVSIIVNTSNSTSRPDSSSHNSQVPVIILGNASLGEHSQTATVHNQHPSTTTNTNKRPVVIGTTIGAARKTNTDKVTKVDFLRDQKQGQRIEIRFDDPRSSSKSVSGLHKAVVAVQLLMADAAHSDNITSMGTSGNVDEMRIPDNFTEIFVGSLPAHNHKINLPIHRTIVADVCRSTVTPVFLKVFMAVEFPETGIARSFFSCPISTVSNLPSTEAKAEWFGPEMCTSSTMPNGTTYELTTFTRQYWDKFDKTRQC